MPSTVGLQKSEVDVVTQAVKLELDCVGAYTEAAHALKDQAAIDIFQHMAKDCQSHVDVWQLRLKVLGAPLAEKNVVTQALNRFKVKAAGVFGTACVARAVKNNPQDTMTAYNRVADRKDLDVATRTIAAKFLPDAAQHLAWIEALLHGKAPAPATHAPSN